MLQIVSDLRGYSIEANDGTIGTVNDFLFDDSTFKVRWLVVDTGKWLTERKVLIDPSAIHHADHWTRKLAAELTKSQVASTSLIHPTRSRKSTGRAVTSSLTSRAIRKGEPSVESCSLD